MLLFDRMYGCICGVVAPVLFVYKANEREMEVGGAYFGAIRRMYIHTCACARLFLRFPVCTSPPIFIFMGYHGM